jgi:hypothetical protein
MKEDYTNIVDTLNEFDIQYTIEKQKNNKLNYLDITIKNTHNTLTFDIYRKPTTTDLIIHNDSCHPHEHKNSAIRYLVTRMNTYPISKENKYQELQQRLLTFAGICKIAARHGERRRSRVCEPCLMQLVRQDTRSCKTQTGRKL